MTLIGKYNEKNRVSIWRYKINLIDKTQRVSILSNNFKELQNKLDMLFKIKFDEDDIVFNKCSYLNKSTFIDDSKEESPIDYRYFTGCGINA